MFNITQGTLSKSTEKLSSGYQINRAADDAAGLSISEKMRKQIRGLSQASTNAEDGISAVQTAEGALTEVQDMLQRMNELAVKAANGTNSTTDRDAIQAEIDQLTTEIDRVSETTKFNETYLLKGDEDGDKSINFQYKATDALSTDLYYVEDNQVKTLKAGTLFAAFDTDGTYYSDSTGVVAGTKLVASDSTAYVASSSVIKAGANVYVTGSDGNLYKVDSGTPFDAATTYYTATASNASAVVESDVVVAATANITGTGYLLQKSVYDSNGNTVDSGNSVGTAATDIANFYSDTAYAILGTNSVALDKYKINSVVQFVDKEGNEIAANGLYKYLDDSGNLKPDSGLYVKTGEGLSDHRAAAKEDVDAMVDKSKKYEMGVLTLKLHVGADATSNNQITLGIDAMSAESLGVKGLKVDGEDDTNALNAIETISAALERVSSQRSALGAVQNRLEHTINNLDNVVENTTSAESQIRDTDMATEMVRYSNAQVLSQAGQAMLAQANQSNQGVLSLLG
jgi:flagellin